VALLKKVKKSRKTNLNTIEHSAKVFFNGHYIRKWMRRLFKLKIIKRTEKKKLLHSPAYKREK
jgi:hypothetical protein